MQVSESKFEIYQLVSSSPVRSLLLGLASSMALLDDTDEVEESGSSTTELAVVCLWDSLRWLKLCAVPIGGKFGCGYCWLLWYCCRPWLATPWSIFRTIGRNLADSVRIPENCKWYNSSSSYSLILFIWYGRSSSLNEHTDTQCLIMDNWYESISPYTRGHESPLILRLQHFVQARHSAFAGWEIWTFW